MKGLILILYLANILVAGWISITSLFYPKLAQQSVFSGTVAYSEVIRLVGALWGAIFIISLLGLVFPNQMRFIFFYQFIYKSSWLLIVALPAAISHKPYPSAMAGFFVVWVIILPLVIPWSALFTYG